MILLTVSPAGIVVLRRLAPLLSKVMVAVRRTRIHGCHRQVKSTKDANGDTQHDMFDKGVGFMSFESYVHSASC
jgi:hypothetical protein